MLVQFLLETCLRDG